jgi:hypothetical protein
MEEVKTEHEEETVRRPTGCDVAVLRTFGTRHDNLLKQRLLLRRYIKTQDCQFKLKSCHMLHIFHVFKIYYKLFLQRICLRIQ